MKSQNIQNQTKTEIDFEAIINALNQAKPSTIVSNPIAMELTTNQASRPNSSFSPLLAQKIDSTNNTESVSDSKNDQENLELIQRFTSNIRSIDKAERDSLVRRVIEESKIRSKELFSSTSTNINISQDQDRLNQENLVLDNVIDRQLSGLAESRKYLLGKIILTKLDDNQDLQNQSSIGLFDLVKLTDSKNEDLTQEQRMLAEMLREVDKKFVELQGLKSNEDREKILEQMRQAEARFIEEILEYQEKQKKQKDNSKTTPKAQNLTELFGGNSTMENSGLTYEIREIEVNDHATYQPSSNMQIVFVDPLIHYQQKVSQISQGNSQDEVSSPSQSTAITPVNAVSLGAQLQVPSNSVGNANVSSLVRNISLTPSTSVLSPRLSEANIGKPVLGSHTARVVSDESNNISMGRG